MKKQQHQNLATPAFDKFDLLGESEDNAIMQWITRHFQMIFYAIFGGFLLLLLLYYWTSSGSAKAETDYLNAIKDFQSFQKVPSAKSEEITENEAFQKLNSIIERRPDLHAKYDGLIAQSLIDKGQINEATPFAKMSLQRINKDHLPFSIDYSTNTLLAIENQETKALASSIALNKQIEENQAQFAMPILYGFNLLRIALLQQKNSTPEEELKSWKAWKQFEIESKEKNIYPEILSITNLFTEGKVSFADYVESRIKKLQK